MVEGYKWGKGARQRENQKSLIGKGEMKMKLELRQGKLSGEREMES